MAGRGPQNFSPEAPDGENPNLQRVDQGPAGLRPFDLDHVDGLSLDMWPIWNSQDFIFESDLFPLSLEGGLEAESLVPDCLCLTLASVTY